MSQAKWSEVQAFQLKAETWMRIFGRESVASVVGALLVLSFGIVLTVAMFKSIAVTSVIENSFLLVLGYFFGQGVARGTSARV